MGQADALNCTKEEAHDLIVACNAWCMCEFDETTGARMSTCAAHKMLLEDDHQTVYRLIFVKRMLAEKLLAQEHEERH